MRFNATGDQFFNMGEFRIAGCAHPRTQPHHGRPAGLGAHRIEMIGPLDQGPAVWSALVEAGAEFGLQQGGGLAYPTTALETDGSRSPSRPSTQVTR